MTAYHPPFIDERAAKARSSKPYAVILRGGTTGSLIEIHHFATAQDAVAFYEEHSA